MTKPRIKHKYFYIFSLCFLFFIFYFLFLSENAEAWLITKELKQELTAKKAALAKSPNNPKALFDLAITYGYTNHLIDGMKTLKKVHETDPAYKKQALKEYVIKVTKNPSDWKLRFRLAFAYYFNDNKKEAIREFKNVLKIDPYNVWAYGYIALLYGEMDETDTAMQYIKKGLKIDSDVAALHLLLAEGYYKKGDSWRGFFERMEALRLKTLGY